MKRKSCLVDGWVGWLVVDMLETLVDIEGNQEGKWDNRVEMGVLVGVGVEVGVEVGVGPVILAGNRVCTLDIVVFVGMVQAVLRVVDKMKQRGPRWIAVVVVVVVVGTNEEGCSLGDLELVRDSGVVVVVGRVVVVVADDRVGRSIDDHTHHLEVGPSTSTKPRVSQTDHCHPLPFQHETVAVVQAAQCHQHVQQRLTKCCRHQSHTHIH